MRVEAAVFVNDNDGRTLALGLGAHKVAVDLAVGRIVGDTLRCQARVIGCDDGGLRVVVLQQRQQRCPGCGRARETGEPIKEIAAVHAAVRELVVQINDALIHWRSPGCYDLRCSRHAGRDEQLLQAIYILNQTEPIGLATEPLSQWHVSRAHPYMIGHTMTPRSSSSRVLLGTCAYVVVAF